MKIKDILNVLEEFAPPSLQEHYDNAGLITGNPEWDCTGILCTLDSVEEVIQEAITKKCNLIVAHHPIIFRGLKRITGNNYVERSVILAIRNDIAIYSIHTNLDNVLKGVNGKMAGLLGLSNTRVLSPKEGILQKLFCFVPLREADAVRQAIFDAGGGNIGRYSECSFNVEGMGTFKGAQDTHPFVGDPGKLHQEKEIKMEIIFPAWLQKRILKAMLSAHPYEEVAYDIVTLANTHSMTGSGLVGDLENPLTETEFLQRLKSAFKLELVRHTALTGRKVKRVALCGGSGSFLIANALENRADFYLSSDIKYHEFFDADGRMVVADIGHFESEQFTRELLNEILREKFPTFAVLKSEVQTNPVQYFF